MRIFLLCICVWWSSGHLLAQEAIPADPVAAQLLGQGKAYLEMGNYPLALEAFEAAAARPFHRASTAAYYLTALTYFRAGLHDEAYRLFSGFVAAYPASHYATEAVFHRARLVLSQRRAEASPAAVRDLLVIYDSTVQAGLRADIEGVLQQYLFFVAEERELEPLWAAAPDRADRLFMEAWAYRRLRAGRKGQAERAYARYLREGGVPSAFLERLFSLEQTVKYVEPGLSRIALMLPLFLTGQPVDSLAEVPARHRPALEFYEGFMIAIETQAPLREKRVFVEVFDTWRDSARLAQQLAQLDARQPDIVVGEIYNDRSAQLAEWAERTGTPQLVPLSPAGSLAEGRSYVFLAHPTAAGHGQAMATYARDSLRLRRVALWTDGRAGTERLAEAFAATFDTLGGEILRLAVDSVYDDSTRYQIYSLVRSLRFQDVDGVYIPILDNQEVAGLILSQMRVMDLDVAVMGGPHWWHRYDNIDRDLKNSYQLLFSTGYMMDRNDPERANFEQQYLRTYHLPPSNYAVQGYDIAMYLLHVLDSYDYREGWSLASYLRMHPVFRGIHINFDFGEGQINRFVNIGAYRDGDIIKVNGGERLSLFEIFPVQDD